MILVVCLTIANIRDFGVQLVTSLLDVVRLGQSFQVKVQLLIFLATTKKTHITNGNYISRCELMHY